MTSSEFINKFKSKYLWGNIGAMILVLVLLCAGVKYGIDIYTHHGGKSVCRIFDIRISMMLHISSTMRDWKLL